MFHTSTESFSVHTKRTHHMWNYIYYLVMLLEKPKEALTGPEAAILEKFLKKDLSWFPLHRTKLLTERQHEEHTLSKRLDVLGKKLEYVTHHCVKQPEGAANGASAEAAYGGTKGSTGDTRRELF